MAASQRRELGAFLRGKRAALQPEQVGLPPGIRRRTPGLRREEVALLAEVSVAWYTWLEQGRTIQPSPRTLSGVLDVLRCSDEERLYLRGLLRAASTPPEDAWNPALQQVLDALLPAPALLLNRHWQRLAQNASVRSLGVSLGLLLEVEESRSLLDLMFLYEETRAAVINWPEQARQLVAAFRLDSSRYPEDDWFPQKVAALSAANPEFAQYWAEQQVRRHAATQVCLQHPEFGELVLNTTWLQVIGAAHLKLLVFTADPASPTGRLLTQMADPNE